MEGKRGYEKRVSLKKLTQVMNLDYFVSSRADYHDSIIAGCVFSSVHITPTAWEENANHGFFKKIYKKRQLVRKFNNKKLIALSEGIEHDLVNNIQCDPENVFVINNPFELDVILKKSIQAKSLYDFEYIVFVASFIERKRHIDMIDAFEMLENKCIKLVLVGKGKLESRIRDLVKAKGLENRVIFHGWDSNPYSIIKNAKLSVLASLSEGLPRVVVESLALGVPVVSTDCPSGPKEVLTGDFKKFLVPLRSPVALSTAINEALISYPEIKSDLVVRFDASYIANNYIKLFELN